jgi:hypothetical protein
MVKLRYPRVIWRKSKSDLVYKTCVLCGKKFSKDETIVIKETQFSWFRGDDIREAICMKCLPSREKRRPENLRM